MAVKKKAAKKATAKKAPAKKATKKVATKKAAPKTTKKVAKKATAKKAPAKKATAKKATTTKKVAAKAKAPKAAKPKTKRKPNAAFMKPLTPSTELAAVVGAKPLPRTAVVSKIWDYIKKHNLQNPKNKRNIIADDTLKKVFGKAEISMFELAKIVGKHLS